LPGVCEDPSQQLQGGCIHMALPAQALLHRLRAHSVHGHTDAAWVAYMFAHFRKSTSAGKSTLGEAPLVAWSASTTPPSSLLDLLVIKGSGGGGDCGGGGGGSDSGSSSVAGRVWRLAVDAYGCLEVQQALEAASDEGRWALARELRGHIREACRCPHANYVVQKCITSLAPKMLQFIIDELTQNNAVLGIARHNCGCRIVQLLIEHCPTEQVHDLVELLLGQFSEISRHAYGRFVMQKLLQHVAREQQPRVVELVEQHVSELACHRHGCTVICAALENGDLADRYRLAEMVLEDSNQVAFMAGTRHGRSIITNLLDLSDGSGCQRLLAILKGNPKLGKVLRCRSEGGDVYC